jgi:hypothetical protein
VRFATLLQAKLAAAQEAALTAQQQAQAALDAEAAAKAKIEAELQVHSTNTI